MKTSDFISQLGRAPQLPLLFADAHGRTIHTGYHLTELKNASFETVDCGGQLNRWDETIVQLWVPADPDDDYMTAAKFLKIFDKVRGMISLHLDAEIRIEYGDDNLFPSTYHVRSVQHDQTMTRVLLEPPATTCKARDRQICCNSKSVAETCCASA
jgi:hypothetical protein